MISWQVWYSRSNRNYSHWKTVSKGDPETMQGFREAYKEELRQYDGSNPDNCSPETAASVLRDLLEMDGWPSSFLRQLATEDERVQQVADEVELWNDAVIRLKADLESSILSTVTQKLSELKQQGLDNRALEELVSAVELTSSYTTFDFKMNPKEIVASLD